MCLSNNRYQRASVKFTDTILLGLEILQEGQVEHVVGYFNKVSANPQIAAISAGIDSDDLLRGSAPKRRGSMSLTAPRRRRPTTAGADFDWSTPAPGTTGIGGKLSGNAMLIAIPAKPGTVTAANLVPVGKYPSFMHDYARAVQPRPAFLSDGMRRGRSMSNAKSVEIVRNFDGGTYDVVIAGSAKAIVNAIDGVAEDKRPQVNAELYKKLDKLYPKWTFILFCFSEDTAAKAGCALVRYTPMVKTAHLLYLPGLDGHNGEIETGKVELNHTLVVGSYKMSPDADTRDVHFRDEGITQALPFLCRQVVGKVIPAGTMANQGDFLFSLDEVRKGTFRARRALPPGWEKVFGKSTAAPEYIES